jgi:hypothetical protein
LNKNPEKMKLFSKGNLEMMLVVVAGVMVANFVHDKYVAPRIKKA